MGAEKVKLTCVICQHWWKARAGESPRRCPNIKCRSVKWKDGVDRRADLATVVIRMSREEFEKYGRASKAAGKGTSEWFRSLAAAAVSVPALSREDPILKQMIHEGKAEFVSSANAREKSASGFSNIVRNMAAEVGLNTTYEATMAGISSEGKAINPRKTPAELAANVSGLRVGLGNPKATLPTPEEVELMTPEQRKDYYEHGCAIGLGYLRLNELANDTTKVDNITLVHPDKETQMIQINYGPPPTQEVIDRMNDGFVAPEPIMFEVWPVGLPKPQAGRTLFNPERAVPLTGYAERVEARGEELRAEGVDVLEQIFPAEASVLMVGLHSPLVDRIELHGAILSPRDTPEEPVRSWAEEFARCRKLGDFGAEAFGEATEHIKKWPKGFKNWNEQKQVAWLDANHPLDGR